MTTERPEVSLNPLAGNAVNWDAADSGSVSKAVEALLGLGIGSALLARGRLSEEEQKCSLKLLMRGFRMEQRKKRRRARAKGEDMPFGEMSNSKRLAFLNLALSISRDGEGRRETVSALVGQIARRAVSRGQRLFGIGRRAERVEE